MSDTDRDYLDLTAAVHRAVSAHAHRTGHPIGYWARDRIACEAWQELHPGSTARRPWDAPKPPTPSPVVGVELRNGQLVIVDDTTDPGRIEAALNRMAELVRTIKGLV
ncbi:hypothetical protein [Nocardia sp. No.11]|uniref:hypothetical protein n=1 Tax=Nocardia sp. No.11 TaxID=3128861 RepID=UPI00319E639A